MFTLKLKPQRSKPFWQGESLVFSGALDPKQKTPTDVELVLIAESSGKILGAGFYNPHSSYRVRILHHSATPSTDLTEILSKNIQTALQFRQTLNLPSEATNAYRLINSEGDFLSGLTIDCFGNHLVLAVTATWVMKHQTDIESILKTYFPDHIIHWRPHLSALKQDGWVMDNQVIPDKSNTDSNLISILENNITYQVDVNKGQKTGFYCDQRENRLALREFAKDKKILDTFCYTGGFALNAAKADASSVLAIDSSESALNLARQNAELNQLKNITFEKHDVEKYLSDTSEQFDIIILDPPKLAPSREKIYAAKRQYLKLNKLALNKLNPGGLLITCSCSDAFGKDLFKETLELASKHLSQPIQIQKVTGAGPDHKLPPNARYGDYLKAFWLRKLA